MSMSGASAAAAVTGAVLCSDMSARILLNGCGVQLTTGSEGVPFGRGRRGALPVLAAALVIAATGARADEVVWRDIESRIQYGYYTEDGASLRKLDELIAAGDAHDKLRGYY